MDERYLTKKRQTRVEEGDFFVYFVGLDSRSSKRTFTNSTETRPNLTIRLCCRLCRSVRSPSRTLRSSRVLIVADLVVILDVNTYFLLFLSLATGVCGILFDQLVWLPNQQKHVSERKTKRAVNRREYRTSTPKILIRFGPLHAHIDKPH